MPQKILGIDIGSYSVKVAEIERSFRSFEFVSFYEKKIIKNELLSHDESVALALQGLIDDHDITWDIACCGFPSQHISSRLLKFPFSNRKKIDQTIEFELENYIPFKVDDVVFDYAVLNSLKDFSQVLAVYAPKKEVARILSIVQGIEIDPQYLCVEGVEFVNLVNLGMVPPEGAYAVIDIGHEKTTVGIFHGKKLGYVRAISVAGKSITEAISKELQVSNEEAEKFKIEMGQIPTFESEITDDITKRVVKAIKLVVDDLLLHLRQTLFTYREMENIPVEGIYLSGGSSRLVGIDSYVSSFLKQNVTYLSCSDFHFNKVKNSDAYRHVIPQALAIALREVAGPGHPDINFRYGEFAFLGNVEQIGGGLKKAGFIIGIIIFLALLNFSLKYYTVKQKLDKVGDNGAELVMQALPNTPKKVISTPTSALSVLKGKQVEINDRIAKLQEAFGVSPFDILKEISNVMPSREEVAVDVSEINITQDRVTLSGRTNSFETVDKVKLTMEKSKLFSNVSTGNVRKGTKGEVKFDLSMELDQEEAGEGEK